MHTIDISDIAKQNHAYAIHLATHHNVLSYKNSLFSIKEVSDKSAFESIDFWRDVSLSIELLLKACLLKYHIPFFKKRAHGDYGHKVSATHNPWLEDTLKRLDIEYIAQINTGTISTSIRSAEESLFESITFDPKKAKLISEMLYIIIRTRRNRNNHFFFPNQAKIEMSDVEILYLPLLNMLEELYDAEN